MKQAKIVVAKKAMALWCSGLATDETTRSVNFLMRMEQCVLYQARIYQLLDYLTGHCKQAERQSKAKDIMNTSASTLHLLISLGLVTKIEAVFVQVRTGRVTNLYLIVTLAARLQSHVACFFF